MADTDALWGGTLTDLRVDVRDRSAVLGIQVTSGESQTQYEVRLDGVSTLRMERPDPSEWSYTEVTEVHVTSVGTDNHIEFVFWVEPNGLAATCENLRVTERP